MYVYGYSEAYFPVDTGRKLNVHKTFRKCPGRYLNVLCTFNLCPVSTGLGSKINCENNYKCENNYNCWLLLQNVSS